MKRKLGAILLVVALAVTLGLVPAASVGAASDSMTVVSDTTTQVISGNTGSFPHPASLAWVHSAWWPGLSYNFGYPSNVAQWIWESVNVVHPVAGDVVDFRKTFYIPGVPTAGTLNITCDNGYDLVVNGSYIGSAQVYDYMGTYWEFSDLTQNYVTTDNWQTVEDYDILGDLQPGWNVFDIKAGNEQMDGGTINSNPAGLIFEIDIEYAVPDIEKVLVSSNPPLVSDTNDNDVDELPINTTTFFTMYITVTNSTPATLNNIVVQDNLGGDLKLYSTNVPGDAYSTFYEWSPPSGPGKKTPVVDNTGNITVLWTGKTNKVHLWWTIPSLASGDSAILSLVVVTDINPGQKKKSPPVVEYTSPGINDLNSGATIRSAEIGGIVVQFVDLQTDPIQVESMGEEDD